MANDLSQTMEYESPVTENYWNRITLNTTPHSIFNNDWSTFGLYDFSGTFLPSVTPVGSKPLSIFDGAELFNRNSLSDKNVHLISGNKQPIEMAVYTYPEGAVAGQRKSDVQLRENQVAVFMEINKALDVVLRFKFGRTFNAFVNQYLKDTGSVETAASKENKAYQTNYDSITAYFKKQLSHYNMSQYVLDILGIDSQVFENLDELFDFSKYEVEKPIDERDDFCDDNYLPEFDKFNTFPKVAAKELDCEVQFYRSEEHSKGKHGKDDKGYNGNFGFDLYDEDTSGNGQLSLKYFPDITKIGDNYKAPFLTLWAPKSALPDIIKADSSFIPVSKAEIWFKLSQNKRDKDSSKKEGNLYYETNHPDVFINGKNQGDIFKNPSNESFTVGDTGKFTIECRGVIKNYVFVTVKETDQTGKVIGVLVIVPNDRIYTTNVNLIDVKLGALNLLKDGKSAHPLAIPLQNFFNQKSFNQAFIYVNVRSVGQEMTVDQKQVPNISVDAAGKRYILLSNERKFSDNIVSIYTNLINSRAGTSKGKDYSYINETINEVEVSSDKVITKAKKETQKAVRKLVKEAIGEFKRHKKDLSIKDIFMSPNLQIAIKEYKEKVSIYREELFQKVMADLNNSSKFKGSASLGYYTDTIKNAIYSAIKLEDSSAASVSTTNDVYMYLYKEIDSLREYAEAPGSIAGVTTTGDGYVHILDVALGAPERDELVAHELGHAFGLSHPWEQNEKAIEKQFEKDSKDLEENMEKTLAGTSKDNSDSMPRLKVYYDRMNTTIESFEKNDQFKYNTELHDMDIVFSEKHISDTIENEGKFRGRVTTNEQKKLDFQKQKESLENKRINDLNKTLNLSMGGTVENFMDYKVQARKSYWYWQWINMHCSAEPLKLNKL